MYRAFNFAALTRRPQIRTAGARTVSSTTSPSSPRNSPFVYLATGLLIGGAATASVFKYRAARAAKPDTNVDTSPEPRWREKEDHHATLRSKYADKKTMLKAVDEIRRELGDEAVSVDVDDLEEHGHSDYSASNTDERPVAVVRPRSTEQVSTIARICTRYRVPMVPYGAGSSVEGNFSSPFSGICIDLSTMNDIVAFHPEDMDVVVQPGVNWIKLNEEIKESGLFLPLDPGPTALIGGMVATNCSGTNAMRYGTMKDYVMNLTVVLADGSVIKTRHRPRKTSAGYNLTALFTGSEGTLGIITEITVRLATIPTSFSVATVTFKTLKEAAAAASAMVRTGLPLAALELMDDVQMQVVNKSGGAGGRMWEESPTLFIKFSGTTNTIKDNIQSAQEIAQRFGSNSFEFARNDAEMDSLWAARKLALWATLAVKPKGTHFWGTDVAVPISRMADLIGIPELNYPPLPNVEHEKLTHKVEESKDKASKLGLFNTVLGHVGDGNFHQMLVYRPDSTEDKKAVADCVNAMIDKAIEMEGTVSGEHGIGLGKKSCLMKELGPSTIGVMKALKDTLDPQQGF